MLDSNSKNDATAAKTLDDGCTIPLEETERLIESMKTQNPQLCIEFNDLCYSVTNNKGKLVHRPTFA